MPKKIDMTGWVMKEHGVPDSKLTILYELPERKNKKIIWHCKCECGNECNIESGNLRNGNTKSCGCFNIEKTKKRSIKNLTGQQFGYLIVVYDTKKRTSDGHVIWKCKCKCGNECEVSGHSLTSGNTKSCGCLQKKKASELKLKIIPKGTKFGKLTVLELSSKREKGETFYTCRCECGNQCEIRRSSLTSNKTQSCGCIKSKGEAKISQILKQNDINFEQQKKFEDCYFLDTNGLARFDFYIDNKYIIEYDGEQHFKAVDSGWNTKEQLKKTQEHDNFKNEYCKNHNIPIIRIPYTHLNNLCLEDLLLETSQFLLKHEE